MKRTLWTAGLVIAGLVGLARHGVAGDPVFHDWCNDYCPEKVCRPVVETRTVSKRVYGEVCTDYCPLRCRLCSLFGMCNTCNCGKPLVHKDLLLKIRKHEECVNKCVVEQSCPPPPCVGPGTLPVMAPPGPQAPRMPVPPPPPATPPSK